MLNILAGDSRLSVDSDNVPLYLVKFEIMIHYTTTKADDLAVIEEYCIE